MTLFALSYFLRRWCLRFGIKLANAMEWLPRIFSASLSIPCFHPCNLSHEYLPNECFIKPLSSSHHLFHGHHLYRKGLQFCFFATNKEIGTRQSFLQKKHGTLVQCYPRWAKNLAASRNFCKNFFFSKFTLSTFFSTSIGLPAGTIRTLPRGGTLPCVVRRLWNIHIFSQLDSAAMFLEEMSNWLHIFCEFFYLRIL